MYQWFVGVLKLLKAKINPEKCGLWGYMSVKILINQKKGVPLQH